MFALGCRWLSELDYVYNRDDHGHAARRYPRVVTEDWRAGADHLQPAAMTRRQIEHRPFGVRVEPKRL
jgi:hypothetical protein